MNIQTFGSCSECAPTAAVLACSVIPGSLNYFVVPTDTPPLRFVIVARQGEAYGFTGSRRFLQDWRGAGVSCQNEADPSVTPTGMEACLDPLYPSLEFRKLGRPAHVLAVDQVHIPPPPYPFVVVVLD